MKGEFQIFKKLKFGESDLGWNEMNKIIVDTCYTGL